MGEETNFEPIPERDVDDEDENEEDEHLQFEAKEEEVVGAPIEEAPQTSVAEEEIVPVEEQVVPVEEEVVPVEELDELPQEEETNFEPISEHNVNDEVDW